MKIRKANWELARQKAYDVIRRHNVREFPIDIKKIIQQYKNIKIITYKEFASKRGITVKEAILINSSQDGCIHYLPKKDRYIIAYNDEIRVPERVYWTLAHEFAHYLLNHFKESNRSTLTRNDMTEEEYDLYEAEADFLTRFLINPPSIIQEWNEINVHRVTGFFKVSYTAAQNSISYLQKNADNGRSIIAPKDIKEQLRKFIHDVNHGKTCRECNSFFVLDDPFYCPICGSTRLHNINKGNDINMIYHGIKVDNKSRAICCPVCKNEELYYDGDKCIICNSFLVSKCADIYKYNYEYGENHLESKSCETLLPGNARYCTNCENKSTFYELGYLEAWDKEKVL